MLHGRAATAEEMVKEVGDTSMTPAFESAGGKNGENEGYLPTSVLSLVQQYLSCRLRDTISCHPSLV